MFLNIKVIITGTLISVIITGLLMLAVTALIYCGALGINAETVLVYALTATAVIIGAVYVAKKCNKNVLPNCMCFSAIYITLLLCVSAVVNNGTVFNTHFVMLLIGVVLCAFFGAIIGKN